METQVLPALTVACFDLTVHALNKLPYAKLDSKAVGIREGVVFLTYSSLIASSDKGHSRLDQLVKWCGSGFDGLIVFDEVCIFVSSMLRKPACCDSTVQG